MFKRKEPESSQPAAAKKAKGAPTCGACGASSEDRCLTREITQTDVSWALRSKVKGVETPVGEQCHRCWEVWHTAFQHHSWESLVDGLKTDTDLKDQWTQALETHSGVARPTWPATTVAQVAGFGFEISRQYIVLNEREMKKRFQLGRVTKEFTKGIPTVEVKTANGTNELLYCFVRDDEPYRQLSVKMRFEDEISVAKLEPKGYLWQEQGQACLQAVHTEFSNKCGLSELVNKDAVLSLASFAEQKAKGTPEKSSSCAEDEEGVDSDDDMENPLASKELVGPAAATVPVPKAKPKAKGAMKKRAKWAVLQRGGSGDLDVASLASTKRVLFPSAPSDTPGDANRVDSASTLGEAADEGVELCFCPLDQQYTHFGEGEHYVDYWKQKLPLQSIIDKEGKVDGRTMVGMHRSSKTLLAAPTPEVRIEGTFIQTYHNQCNILLKQSSADIKTLDQPTYNDWVKVVHENGLQTPVKYQRAVLSRHCAQALHEEDMKKVLQLMSPFAEADMASEFDVCSPTLNSLTATQKDKMQSFMDFAKDILVPLIAAGTCAQKKVLNFCNLCKETFEQMDFLEMDMNTAALLGACKSSWSAL
eukprot:2601735-Amphidinium_carterae.3